MDVIKYLKGFFKGTKNPTLDAMNYFMDEFNHPEKKLKFIHIAGTNGKGSVTEMLTSILVEAGYKTGKFISPHLIRYNERISINNKNITNKELERLIKKVKPKVDKYNKNNTNKITLFELITTIAILYYYENKCDIVVLETGLGGTYDCTNIVNPLVSVITSIGFDHMGILGNSIIEIADNKAGIIKENSNTIYSLNDNKKVNDLIINKCKNMNNKLYIVEDNINNYSYNDKYQIFDYNNYKNIKINLKGEKQITNTCLSIKTIEILNSMGYKISDENIKNGLKGVIHKGRLEVINKKPLVVFDGAHNEPAIDNFIKSINMYYKNDNKTYVISILNTKDYNMILKKIVNNKDRFIFTSGNDKNRYMNKDILFNCAKKYSNSNNLYTDSLENIINNLNKYKDSTIIFVGSFYIYGTIINLLKKKNDH